MKQLKGEIDLPGCIGVQAKTKRIATHTWAPLNLCLEKNRLEAERQRRAIQPHTPVSDDVGFLQCRDSRQPRKWPIAHQGQKEALPAKYWNVNSHPRARHSSIACFHLPRYK